MPIDTMQKELLIRMSLFLGNENHKRLSCTAKPFKNLDIEKALCSESVTIDGYLLNKIRLYTLPDTTNQDIDQPRAEASATAIKELVIASDAAKHLTNDDLTKLADLNFIHEKTEVINLEKCNQITDLKPLERCSALTSLDLTKCQQITDLSTLPVLPALTKIILWGCTKITDLSLFANHPTLSELIGPNGEEVDLTSLSNTQQPGP